MLPLELRNKIFCFLSHPCADMIRSERARLFIEPEGPGQEFGEYQDYFTYHLFQVFYFLRWKKVRRALQPYNRYMRFIIALYPEWINELGNHLVRAGSELLLGILHVGVVGIEVHVVVFQSVGAVGAMATACIDGVARLFEVEGRVDALEVRPLQQAR